MKSKMEMNLEVVHNKNEATGKEKFFSPEQVEVLKKRTHELLETVIDGDLDALIFMDKSARPLYWMFKAAWEKLDPKRKEMPKVKFVNIGREKIDFDNIWLDDDEEDNDRETKTLSFWSQFESEEYLKKIDKELGLSKTPQKILLIDDFSGSGFSIDLARKFFEHHFPQTEVFTNIFLKKADIPVFKKAGWYGTHLLWNTDKHLTLLSTEDKPAAVVSSPERDQMKRLEGLRLRKEIEGIFKD